MYANNNTNTYDNTNANNNANMNGYANTNVNGYDNTNANANVNGYTNTNANGCDNANANPYANTNDNNQQVSNSNPFDDPKEVVDEKSHAAEDNPFDDPNEVVENQEQYKDYTNMYHNPDDSFEPTRQAQSTNATNEASYSQTSDKVRPAAQTESTPNFNQREHHHHHHHHHHRQSLHEMSNSSNKFFEKTESGMDKALSKTDDKVGKPIVHFSTKVNDAFTKLFHLK